MASAIPFSKMEYQRIPLDELKIQYEGLQERLRSADAGAIVEIVREWNRVRSRYQTMSYLNSVHYTIDTRDLAIKQERKFLDEQEPTVEEWNTAMRRALLEHTHRSAIEREFGSQLISSMETAIQTFDPRIADHLKKQADL